MLCFLFGFGVALAGCGTVFWLACRRITKHLQGRPDAVKAVTDHVLLPLLGKTPADDIPFAPQAPDGPEATNHQVGPGSGSKRP